MVWRTLLACRVLLKAAAFFALALLAVTSPALAQATIFHDFTVSMDGGPDDTLDRGTPISYLITVTNLGPDSGQPEFTAQLPSGIDFASVSGTAGWTCTTGPGSTTTCHTDATLAASASATYTINGQVSNSAPLGDPQTATVEVHEFVTDPSTIDPNDENNSASFNIYVNGGTFADLGITYQALGSSSLGSEVIFNAVVTNNGPNTATNTTVAFSTPGNATAGALDSESPWVCTPAAPYSCTADLPPGTTNFSFHVTATDNSQVDSIATLTRDAGVTDNSPENDGPAVAIAYPVSGTTTTTVLGSSDAVSDLGQAVTFTATVTGTTTPNGVVTFLSGAAVIGTASLNGSGVATLSVSDLPAGPHTITAQYGGATGFAPSNGTLLQTVNKVAAFPVVTQSVNPIIAGNPVTFTLTYAPQPGTSFMPTGSVTFTDPTVQTLPLVNGVVSITIANPQVGTQPLGFIYGGDSNYIISVVPYSYTVQPPAGTTTSTALTSSANPTDPGDPVTFTATVTPSSGGPATGTVTFKDGTTTLGSGTLSSGVATLTTSTLTPGSHSITAVYNGDATFASSTSPVVTQVVRGIPKVASSTTLTSSANPSTAGTDVTFTATVAGSSGTPKGTVTFKDGTTTLGTTALKAGVATFTTDALAVGSHAITAHYNGSTSYAASTSAVLTQEVKAPVIDVGVVRDTFLALGQDFVETRNDLLSTEVDPPGLNDLPPNTLGVQSSGGAPVLNFFASSDTPAGSAADALAAGAVPVPFRIWIDGTFALHNDPDSEGQFGVVGVGADYRVHPGLLAGVALYLDYMTDTKATSAISGKGLLIGPYISTELTDGLVLDASLFYGRSVNDATADLFGTTFTGAFDTSRWIAKAKLEGKLMLDQLIVRPNASLFLSTETASGYTVTDGFGTDVAIPGFTTTTFRLGAGGTVEQVFAVGDDLSLTPMAGLNLGVGGDGATPVLDTLFGTLSVGATLAGEQWSLKGTLGLNADTSGLRSASARVGLQGRF